MNILLVDDDSTVLQELKEILDGRKSDFERIYVASCVEEAKKVLRTVSIQIMLCDIEMPGGLGISLLAWVREEGFGLECIFLTNYADFTYAKAAIRLDSLEYLLKPVDEEQVCAAICRARERVCQSRQDEQARQYWLDTGQEAKEHFWQRSLLSDFPDREKIFEKLGYGEADRFVPAAFKAESISAVEQSWGAAMFEYRLKNILFENFDTRNFHIESVFATQEGIWLLICRCSREMPPDDGAVWEAMQPIPQICAEKLGCEMLCAVGGVCAFTALSEEAGRLKEVLENVLGQENGVLRLSEYQPRDWQYQMPDISVWESLLQQEEKEALMRSIRRYVQRRAEEDWSRRQMQEFRQDITQMFYSWLRESDILAHKLFADRESELYYQRACGSVEDMCLYCGFMAERVISYKKFTKEPRSVIEAILRYVDAHYCEDINRSDLANLVYISPDYCSRIFRRETGKSLARYVQEKRIEKAKKLLEGELSVKNAALQAGYSNFSYFSKVFRELTGMTPAEYRQKLSE